METLVKIESYLRGSLISRLLRFVFLAVFVAVAFGPSVVFMMRVGTQNADDYNIRVSKFGYEKLMQKACALTQQTSAMIKRAEREGDHYSPEMYFHDLRAWRTASKGWGYIGRGPDPERNVNSACNLLYNNMRARLFTVDQLSAAQAKYGFEPRKLTPAQQAKSNAELLAGFERFLAWSLKTYLLGLLLCIPTFLLRLADEERMAGCLKWHRLDLLKAIALWPKAFTEFPHNLPLNALEMARWRMGSGDLWAEVSVADRREIAARADAQTLFGWVRAHGWLLLRPAYWTALMATLVMMYLAPMMAWAKAPQSADQAMHSDGASVVQLVADVSRAGPHDSTVLQRNDDSGKTFGAAVASVILPTVGSWVFIVETASFFLWVGMRKLLRVQDLDPVPWIRPLDLTV